MSHTPAERFQRKQHQRPPAPFRARQMTRVRAHTNLQRWTWYVRKEKGMIRRLCGHIQTLRGKGRLRGEQTHQFKSVHGRSTGVRVTYCTS